MYDPTDYLEGYWKNNLRTTEDNLTILNRGFEYVKNNPRSSARYNEPFDIIQYSLDHPDEVLAFEDIDSLFVNLRELDEAHSLLEGLEESYKLGNIGLPEYARYKETGVDIFNEVTGLVAMRVVSYASTFNTEVDDLIRVQDSEGRECKVVYVEPIALKDYEKDGTFKQLEQYAILHSSTGVHYFVVKSEKVGRAIRALRKLVSGGHNQVNRSYFVRPSEVRAMLMRSDKPLTTREEESTRWFMGLLQVEGHLSVERLEDEEDESEGEDLSHSEYSDSDTSEKTQEPEQTLQPSPSKTESKSSTMSSLYGIAKQEKPLLALVDGEERALDLIRVNKVIANPAISDRYIVSKQTSYVFMTKKYYKKSMSATLDTVLTSRPGQYKGDPKVYDMLANMYSVDQLLVEPGNAIYKPAFEKLVNTAFSCDSNITLEDSKGNLVSPISMRINNFDTGIPELVAKGYVSMDPTGSKYIMFGKGVCEQGDAGSVAKVRARVLAKGHKGLEDVLVKVAKVRVNGVNDNDITTAQAARYYKQIVDESRLVEDPTFVPVREEGKNHVYGIRVARKSFFSKLTKLFGKNLLDEDGQYTLLVKPYGSTPVETARLLNAAVAKGKVGKKLQAAILDPLEYESETEEESEIEDEPGTVLVDLDFKEYKGINSFPRLLATSEGDYITLIVVDLVGREGYAKLVEEGLSVINREVKAQYFAVKEPDTDITKDMLDELFTKGTLSQAVYDRLTGSLVQVSQLMVDPETTDKTRAERFMNIINAAKPKGSSKPKPSGAADKFDKKKLYYIDGERTGKDYVPGFWCKPFKVPLAKIAAVDENPLDPQDEVTPLSSYYCMSGESLVMFAITQYEGSDANLYSTNTAKLTEHIELGGNGFCPEDHLATVFDVYDSMRQRMEDEPGWTTPLYEEIQLAVMHNTVALTNDVMDMEDGSRVRAYKIMKSAFPGEFLKRLKWARAPGYSNYHVVFCEEGNVSDTLDRINEDLHNPDAMDLSFYKYGEDTMPPEDSPLYAKYVVGPHFLEHGDILVSHAGSSQIIMTSNYGKVVQPVQVSVKYPGAFKHITNLTDYYVHRDGLYTFYLVAEDAGKDVLARSIETLVGYLQEDYFLEDLLSCQSCLVPIANLQDPDIDPLSIFLHDDIAYKNAIRGVVSFQNAADGIDIVRTSYEARRTRVMADYTMSKNNIESTYIYTAVKHGSGLLIQDNSIPFNDIVIKDEPWLADLKEDTSYVPIPSVDDMTLVGATVLPRMVAVAKGKRVIPVAFVPPIRDDEIKLDDSLLAVVRGSEGQILKYVIFVTGGKAGSLGPTIDYMYSVDSFINEKIGKVLNQIYQGEEGAAKSLSKVGDVKMYLYGYNPNNKNLENIYPKMASRDDKAEITIVLKTFQGNLNSTDTDPDVNKGGKSRPIPQPKTDKRPKKEHKQPKQPKKEPEPEPEPEYFEEEEEEYSEPEPEYYVIDNDGVRHEFDIYDLNDPDTPEEIVTFMQKTYQWDEELPAYAAIEGNNVYIIFKLNGKFFVRFNKQNFWRMIHPMEGALKDGKYNPPNYPFKEFTLFNGDESMLVPPGMPELGGGEDLYLSMVGKKANPNSFPLVVVAVPAKKMLLSGFLFGDHTYMTVGPKTSKMTDLIPDEEEYEEEEEEEPVIKKAPKKSKSSKSSKKSKRK